MALEIQTLRGKNDVAGIIADRRLYLTADSERVVEEGDPDAAFLLAVPGRKIPTGEAARLGLSVVDGRVVQGEGPEADPEHDENYTEIRVEQNGSWYTGYRDDEEVFKVQGEDAMKAAVAELEG